MAVLAAFSAYFLADLVVGVLFGKDYLGAAKILKIHIWTGLFVSIGIVTSKCMVVDGFTKYSLPLGLLSVLINVVLNYILIPSYGGVGAAIATLLTQIITGYFILFVIKDLRHYKIALYTLR